MASPQLNLKKIFEPIVVLFKSLAGTEAMVDNDVSLEDFSKSNNPDDTKTAQELLKSQRNIADNFKTSVKAPKPQRVKSISKEEIEKLKSIPVDQRSTNNEERDDR